MLAWRIRRNLDGETFLLPVMSDRDRADRAGGWHGGARLRRLRPDRSRARGRRGRPHVAGRFASASGAPRTTPASDAHSPLMLAALMIGHHFAISALW